MRELATAMLGGSTPMLVVGSERALGQAFDERAVGQTFDVLARRIRTLRRHNLVVKALSHGAPHPEDARG